MPDIKLTEEQAKEFIDDGWLNVVCGDYRFYLELDQREKRIFYFELTADVRPVVRGRCIWTETGPEDYEQFWVCSECGENNFYESKFCPNCGADMRERKEPLVNEPYKLSKI